ncbi:MAG: hypothetical protein ACI358_03655 [Candidatus Limimorpha sp.]
MSLKITHFLPSAVQEESLFESEIRESVKEICSEMAPSKKTLNAIFQFAAAYDCVDTKIGPVGYILN